MSAPTDQEILDSIRTGLEAIAAGTRVVRVKSANGREMEYQAADVNTLLKLEQYYTARVGRSSGKTHNLAKFM